MAERREPDRGHQAGRAEEFPVEQAERGRGQARAAHERPRRAEPARPAGPAGPQRGRGGDQQQALSRVAEHDPEHHHVAGPGQPGRVDIGVRDRPVRRDQRAERPPQLGAADQRRRLRARRVSQRHHGAAHLGQLPGQLGQAIGGDPAGQRGGPGAGHRRRGVALQLRLTGQQVVPAGPLQRVQVGRPGGQRGAGCLRRCAPGGRRRGPGGPGAGAAQPNRRRPWSLVVGVGPVDLHGRGRSHAHQHVAERAGRGDQGDPRHPDGPGDVKPRHRRPPARRRPGRRSPARPWPGGRRRPGRPPRPAPTAGPTPRYAAA